MPTPAPTAASAPTAAAAAGWFDTDALWISVGLTAVRIAAILIAAWILALVMQRVIKAFRLRVTARMHDTEQIKRAETLGRVSRYLVGVVIAVITVIVVLSELGIAIAPVLGAAGVVGVAVGFGAQSLVKDYLSGFLMLLENQIRQGDVVEIAGKGGVVEEITLRYVRLRDYDGNVHFVANGLITTVSNSSLGFAFSVVDVAVAYREDVDQALQVMRDTAVELSEDPAFAPKILAEVEVVGVEKWLDSGVQLRVRFRVVALEQWTVRREYLRRLKHAFDRAGIEIPYPHLTVYAGVDREGAAPPFHLAHRREAASAAALPPQ
jgi:small-conductance mechanosensitive channel